MFGTVVPHTYLSRDSIVLHTLTQICGENRPSNDNESPGNVASLSF